MDTHAFVRSAMEVWWYNFLRFIIDDIIIIGNDKGRHQLLKVKLDRNFDMFDLAR